MSSPSPTAEETREALLGAIASQVSVAPNATTLLRLAEARELLSSEGLIPG